MGQTLKPFASGRDQKEKDIIGSTIDECYIYFKDKDNDKDLNIEEILKRETKLKRAVCEIVEKINEKVGSTQFRVPKEEILHQAFDAYHKAGKPLTEDEFKNILKAVIIKTKFTGAGGKDLILYIFGVPITALLINQRVSPKPISNDILIPVVTSATVFLLAQLNKI